MALWSTQLLKTDYNENLPRGKGGRFIGMTTLPVSCAGYLEILRVSTTLFYKVTFQTLELEKKFNKPSVRIARQSLGHRTSKKRR
jgi:hypothetical protein